MPLRATHRLGARLVGPPSHGDAALRAAARNPDPSTPPSFDHGRRHGRARSRAAHVVDAIVLANVYGVAPFMGAAYWIPAFWVPALLVTHYLTFVVLLRPDRA